MAGKIEIRASGEKFRFVVLNRNGEKLLQSAQFDDKPSAKRAASSLAKTVSGAEITDATKPASAGAKTSSSRPSARSVYGQSASLGSSAATARAVALLQRRVRFATLLPRPGDRLLW